MKYGTYLEDNRGKKRGGKNGESNVPSLIPFSFFLFLRYHERHDGQGLLVVTAAGVDATIYFDSKGPAIANAIKYRRRSDVRSERTRRLGFL